MSVRIVIAGGYGVVGAATARLLRDISPGADIVLAGRRTEAGEALAREIGARTARLDIAEPQSLISLDGADLVISALHDPADVLLDAAWTLGAGYIAVTSLCDGVAPLMSRAAHAPPTRPIAMFGHWCGGVLSLAVRAASADFRRIDAVSGVALFDHADVLGPMSAGDAEHLMGRAYLRRSGVWTWVEAPQHIREATLFDGAVVPAIPMALLDGPGVAAFTGARDVRFDLAQGVSRGTAAGLRASHDMHLDLAGVRADGTEVTRRLLISDPQGIGRMTALGIAVAAERILGLDGAPAAAGGLYLPETLVDATRAMLWFGSCGVHVETRDEARA